MNSSLRFPWLVGVLLAAALIAGCGNAQSRKARYVTHGKQYFNAAHYDKARVEFSNAAQIDPKDANVRFLLGQVAEKLGDVRGAVGQYQAAIDQDPKLSAARAALARLYLYGGLPDKAMELVEPGLATDPNNPQLLTVRGAARAQLGDAKAAMNDAQKAVQRAPGDDYAVALLASLYRQRSEIEQAIAVVQAGLQRLPKNVDLRAILADLELAQHRPADARAQLEQIIALEPKVLVHRYQLARFYLQQKNIDAAEKTLRDAVNNFPDDVNAKLQLVEFLAAQRSRDQATAQADQFMAREPNNDTLKLDTGELLEQIGQTDRAEHAFRAVITHAGNDPNGLMARDRLAALLVGKNDVAGATALIAQVLQQNARDNDALTLRGNISLARGDIGGAIDDLRAVLRDQPNAVAVMRTLARAYQQNGENELAEETLRSAVQVSPKDFQSRLDLAQILIGANQAGQAEALLEQLGKESPTNIPVLESLFRAQSAQKHNDEARTTAQTIEHVAPKQPLGYYLEGLTDEADQKPDAAAKDYEQALQRGPVTGEPLTALARLDLQRKQPAAAMARVDAVIAKSPTDAIARNLKAELLLAQGQTDAAIAAYQATIQVAPTWALAYHGLALAQIRANHKDDAVRSLQLGVEETQGDSALLLNDLSNLYIGEGRTDDAIALYQDVLTKNPKSSFAANNLAMLLVNYKHDPASLARAQKLADQLSALSVATVIDTRGWVKFKSGDFHAAETLLQQAVDKSPDAPELRYHLGMAQLRSGESQAARENLQSALHSAQPFAGMGDARATLAQLQKSGATG